MKQINEFRSTDSFCINGYDVENIAALVAYYKKSKLKLNTIARDNRADHDEIDIYTVRFIEDRVGLVDARVTVNSITGKVTELERKIIVADRKPLHEDAA